MARFVRLLSSAQNLFLNVERTLAAATDVKQTEVTALAVEWTENSVILVKRTEAIAIAAKQSWTVVRSLAVTTIAATADVIIVVAFVAQKGNPDCN